MHASRDQAMLQRPAPKLRYARAVLEARQPFRILVLGDSVAAG